MVEVYPWLSSLRGFAVEGVDMVLYQVLVGFAFGLSAVPLPQAAAVGFGFCWSAQLSSLLTGRC